MSARILVVDDLAPNRHLMEVKLAAEYYDVVLTSNGTDAIRIVKNERIDLILLDTAMPGLDGFETCQRIKEDASIAHIPIIMVTALEETYDRVRGLEAGADDFVTKPIHDINLISRVRSCLRLKQAADQVLKNLSASGEDYKTVFEKFNSQWGHIVLVENDESRIRKITQPLERQHKVTVIREPKELNTRKKNDIDLLIVSLLSDGFDGLRLSASFRFDQESKDIPILGLGDHDDELMFLRAYDIGVNDILTRPLERQELIARSQTLLKRKFYTDALRDNFNENLEMVIADPLTGLGNRRYFERTVKPLIQEREQGGEKFSILVFDIDYFKRVNDILGHDIGDEVLKEVATRLVTNVRSVDIVSRYGGEEFMVAMPETSLDAAIQAAERIRKSIGGTPVYVEGRVLDVTTSVGVAEAEKGESLREVFKRADEALYKAKREGRDKVVPSLNKKAA